MPGARMRFAIIASWRRRTPPDPLVETALAAL